MGGVCDVARHFQCDTFFFLSYVTQGGNPEQCLVHGDLPKRFIGTGKMVQSVDGC